MAEMEEWDKLYGQLAKRKREVEREEERETKDEVVQEETRTRKWKEVSKKIVRTNIRAVKNVMLDKTVMPKVQKTKEISIMIVILIKHVFGFWRIV